MADAKKKPRRQWRDYRTRAGGRPVKAFLDELTDDEVAAIVAGMKEVVERGLAAGKHLRGDVYEVRADAATRSFRVLFATEGRYSQVLLSLSAFEKRTQKTPSARARACRGPAGRLARARRGQKVGAAIALKLWR